MAHETLKSLIRQYINTNGQESITGQILQDVLIEMVNEYPIVDTYLPLAGGTMTGEIKSGDLLTGSYSLSNDGIGFYYSYTGNTRYEQRIFISAVNQAISFTTRGGQAQGTLINVSSVTSGSFIKLGGTASEFLKADGSVDGNSYLPLAGGTMNGNLNFTLGNVVSIPISEGTRRGNTLNIGLFDVEGTNYAWVYRSWPSNTALAGLDASGYMVGTGYKTPNGTSTQFLKADGSVDNNSYVPMTGLNWGVILFDSASNGTYLRAIGDTFSMAITEGRWAPFSSDPSVLQVSGGRTSGATITYTVAQTVAAKVLIFLVNLDNPQQIIIDNVEIRPL